MRMPSEASPRRDDVSREPRRTLGAELSPRLRWTLSVLVFLLAAAGSLDVLQGREPDIPFVARSRFDSDYFADDGLYPLARERLRDDPRIERLYDGTTFLYRFRDRRNDAFLLDWKVLPPTAPVPPPAALLDGALPAYPRAAAERERAVEGYIDGRRVSDGGACIAFARLLEIDQPSKLDLELAPYGSAEIFVDQSLVAAVPGALLNPPHSRCRPPVP